MVINACSFTLKPGRFYIAAGAALLCGIKIPCGENCRVFCFQWPGRRVAIPWPFCTFSYTALRAFLMRLCGLSNAVLRAAIMRLCRPFQCGYTGFILWLFRLYLAVFSVFFSNDLSGLRVFERGFYGNFQGRKTGVFTPRFYC